MSGAYSVAPWPLQESDADEFVFKDQTRTIAWESDVFDFKDQQQTSSATLVIWNKSPPSASAPLESRIPIFAHPIPPYAQVQKSCTYLSIHKYICVYVYAHIHRCGMHICRHVMCIYAYMSSRWIKEWRETRRALRARTLRIYAHLSMSMCVCVYMCVCTDVYFRGRI